MRSRTTTQTSINPGENYSLIEIDAPEKLIYCTYPKGEAQAKPRVPSTK